MILLLIFYHEYLLFEAYIHLFKDILTFHLQVIETLFFDSPYFCYDFQNILPFPADLRIKNVKMVSKFSENLPKLSVNEPSKFPQMLQDLRH